MRHVDRSAIAALLALCASTGPARADFYRLDGRFECLAKPDAVCFDKTPAAPDPFEKHPAQARDTTAQPPPTALAIRAPITPAPVPPRDPMLAIAERIRRGHPAAEDLAMLRRAAAAGDGQAVELLAWCALQGIGGGRDPIQAYLLYGKAADLAVPHAQENQALVYERSLSSADREHVLEMAAQRPAAGLLSDAEGEAHHVP